MKNKLLTMMLFGILICIAIYAGVFIGRSTSRNMTYISPKSNNVTSNISLNINEVSEDELVINLQLTRSLAREIINYRKTYGDYVYISELKNVPGMTDKVYEQIKPFLVISD